MSKSVTTRIAEYTPKEGKRPHVFKDAEGNEYATYKDEIANQAKPLVGQDAALTFSEVVKGDFTNNYLDAAAPAGNATAGNGATPALGTGDYVKGQTAPSDKRSILASVALREAVSSLSHTIATASTAKDAHAKIIPLADAYYLWLARRTGDQNGDLITDDSIPF